MIAMPMAAVFLVGSGIRVRLLSSLIPGLAGIVLDIGLTIFWTTGITAAFSILDHMDGLCAGIAGIAALFFAVAASLTGQRIVVTLALATFGAAMGFLRWNFNPAKIFMGDGGALFLGYLMAALSLKIRPEDGSDLAKWLVPLLILGVPIFDTSLVSVSRARRGLVPFTSPGKDHTAHRLSNLGFGHRGAVLILYGFATVFGIAGVVTSRLAPAAAFTLAGVLVPCAAIGIFLLEGAPYDRQAKLQQSSPASSGPSF
jgi:UDP-GlcNAc:undecaprenyl-phosphate GlcNAc-1-phosphate transferase